MAHLLNVYALPDYADPRDLAGGTAVVIDVLRASTTIIHALDAGATEVIPCLEVGEARQLAAAMPADRVVLGGERDGRPIEGFDLGNSPVEYDRENVGGKSVVFTTTNGTRAMLHARQADRVLIAGFVNVSAIVEELACVERIHLLCAGTQGEVSRDDVLLAGMLVEQVSKQGTVFQQNAQALTARENWLAAFALPAALGAESILPEALAQRLRDSAGGKNLTDLGLDHDILAASWIDRFRTVPEMAREANRIRAI